MFIRKYTELTLYCLLVASLILHRLYGVPNLGLFILLLPLAFLPQESFGLKSRWNLSLLALPFLYLLHPYNFFNLAFQAFAEELFFRTYLMQRFSNFTVSIMFTAPHVILYQDFFSCLTFFPSILYGFVYKKTQSLALVSILHLSSNLLWFGFLAPQLQKY
ncbi:MAG: CPBP family intramembrane metalloprotease [Aquificaceae bacterium]|nr:CPBP family intramembrane metalloprotease [Aquificaceae bacterium]